MANFMSVSLQSTNNYREPIPSPAPVASSAAFPQGDPLLYELVSVEHDADGNPIPGSIQGRHVNQSGNERYRFHSEKEYLLAVKQAFDWTLFGKKTWLNEELRQRGLPTVYTFADLLQLARIVEVPEEYLETKTISFEQIVNVAIAWSDRHRLQRQSLIDELKGLVTKPGTQPAPGLRTGKRQSRYSSQHDNEFKEAWRLAKSAGIEFKRFCQDKGIPPKQAEATLDRCRKRKAKRVNPSTNSESRSRCRNSK
jgi:hypothetical protein